MESFHLHPVMQRLVAHEVPDPGVATRTQPTQPMKAGSAERRTHYYIRHGTTTLFAALEVATGMVTATPQPRRRHQEFLKQVAKAYPDVELHLVMDNYAPHKRIEVRKWLAANPRIHMHFTPTSGSWQNLVEVWFGIIERQAIYRGTFASVRDLTAKIRLFITGWNDRYHPFVWTKTADQILRKANCPKNLTHGPLATHFGLGHGGQPVDRGS